MHSFVHLKYLCHRFSSKCYQSDKILTAQKSQGRTEVIKFHNVQRNILFFLDTFQQVGKVIMFLIYQSAQCTEAFVNDTFLQACHN